MDLLVEFSTKFINFAVVAFVFLVGLAFLAVIVLYFVDRMQTTSTIKRNYPVIGRFRFFFEHMGEFFRQYFFALDLSLIHI